MSSLSLTRRRPISDAVPCFGWADALSASDRHRGRRPYLRRALAEGAQLKSTRWVCSLIGAAHAELGDALRLWRISTMTRKWHMRRLSLSSKELGDDRGCAVVLAQLGNTGAGRKTSSMKLSSVTVRPSKPSVRSGEPRSVAVLGTSSGTSYRMANRLQNAEQAYRASAQIEEGYADRFGALGKLGPARASDAVGRPAGRRGSVVFQGVEQRCGRGRLIWRRRCLQ